MQRYGEYYHVVRLSGNDKTFPSLIDDCLKTNFIFCNPKTCSNTSIPNTTKYNNQVTSVCFAEAMQPRRQWEERGPRLSTLNYGLVQNASYVFWPCSTISIRWPRVLPAECSQPRPAHRSAVCQSGLSDSTLTDSCQNSWHGYMASYKRQGSILIQKHQEE